MNMAVTPAIYGGRVVNYAGPPKFDVENPGNPSSWYEGVTQGISSSQMWLRDIEKGLTDGIIFGDPSIDPNMFRHQKFQAIAFMSKMYDLLKFAVELGKANKEAEKDTTDLFTRAK